MVITEFLQIVSLRQLSFWIQYKCARRFVPRFPDKSLFLDLKSCVCMNWVFLFGSESLFRCCIKMFLSNYYRVQWTKVVRLLLLTWVQIALEVELFPIINGHCIQPSIHYFPSIISIWLKQLNVTLNSSIQTFTLWASQYFRVDIVPLQSVFRTFQNSNMCINLFRLGTHFGAKCSVRSESTHLPIGNLC